MGDKLSQQVYFISDGQYVKIGLAKDSYQRLKQLQVANPKDLKLIGVCYGTIRFEKELHRRFESSHVRGEWFEITGELVDFLKMVGRLRKPSKPERDPNLVKLQCYVNDRDDVLGHLKKFVEEKYGFTKRVFGIELLKALEFKMALHDFEDFRSKSEAYQEYVKNK